MSNHIHLIVTTLGNRKIGDFVRDMKKHTANEIIEAITNNPTESRKEWMLNMFRYAGSNNNHNEEYQFWRQDYHPICLDTAEKTSQRLQYLHENPVRSGYVWMAEAYKYSSAIDYYANRGVLLSLAKLDLI